MDRNSSIDESVRSLLDQGQTNRFPFKSIMWAPSLELFILLKNTKLLIDCSDSRDFVGELLGIEANCSRNLKSKLSIGS